MFALGIEDEVEKKAKCTVAAGPWNNEIGVMHNVKETRDRCCKKGTLPLCLKVYNVIAKNRYRIFGKTDVCFVPDEGMRARVFE